MTPCQLAGDEIGRAILCLATGRRSPDAAEKHFLQRHEITTQ